jgi:cytochrome P450
MVDRLVSRAVVTAAPIRRRAAPPGPESYFSVNLLRLVARDKLAFFKELARYGDVSQVRFGPRRIALISHPDDIRRILVTEQKKFTKGRALAQTETLLGQGLLTSEGEFHLRQRRMIQPALHRERLAGYGQVMVDYSVSASTSRGPHAPIPEPSVTLRPKGGLPVRLERRPGRG